MKKIIIFLNGRQDESTLRVKTEAVSFPFIQKSREHHHSSTLIFAADNGFKRVLKDKIKYSKLYLFGDLDSISSQNLKKSKQEKNVEITVLPKEKSVNDFGCILDHIQSHFNSTDPFFIEIYGGLGNDKDHEYANIKEVEHFLKSSKHGGIVVMQGHMILSTLSFALTHVRKKYFSVFCAPHVKFSIQNALYSGQFSLDRPSHGLSNCITQSPLLIERSPSADIMTLIVRK